MSVFVILGLLFSTGDPAAVQQKIRLDVPGITWASSAAAASSAASSVKGVISVEDNFSDSTLIIIFDDAITTVDGIKEALNEAEYPVSGPPEYLKH